MTSDLINLLVQNGVLVGVLAWFMFRMEKRIGDLTDAIRELCNEQRKTT